MVVLIIVVVLVVLLVIIGIAMYNGLVRLPHRVENAWAQIDVQLKRRNDLIPNLVETVQSYAQYERTALEAVIAARNQVVTASNPKDAAAADAALTASLRQVFALSEAYPDLKANQNFLSLQEELSATEGRVAYARQFYNDAVLKYNTKIQTAPQVFIARSMRFGPREYFEADESSRATPRVDFDI